MYDLLVGSRCEDWVLVLSENTLCISEFLNVGIMIGSGGMFYFNVLREPVVVNLSYTNLFLRRNSIIMGLLIHVIITDRDMEL